MRVKCSPLNRKCNRTLALQGSFGNVNCLTIVREHLQRSKRGTNFVASVFYERYSPWDCEPMSKRFHPMTHLGAVFLNRCYTLAPSTRYENGNGVPEALRGIETGSLVEILLISKSLSSSVFKPSLLDVVFDASFVKQSVTLCGTELVRIICQNEFVGSLFIISKGNILNAEEY